MVALLSVGTATDDTPGEGDTVKEVTRYMVLGRYDAGLIVRPYEIIAIRDTLEEAVEARADDFGRIIKVTELVEDE